MMDRRRWALAIAGASLIACSSSNSGAPSGPDAGGSDVSETPDSSAPDASETVTQTVGASGGVVKVPGAILTIPAGALPGDTEISIVPNAGPVPSGYTGLTPLFVFGPAGTALLEPATVEFTLATPGTNPTVFWSNASGGFDGLDTTSTVTTASATITLLGSGFVGDLQSVRAADAATSEDAGAGPDASDDASGALDAGAAPDSGPVDAAAIVEGGASDASIVGDGGAVGISITIDGASSPTLFATNPSVSNNGNGIWTLTADDNGSGVRWSVELQVNGLAQQEACQTVGDPLITYTHYVNGAPVAVFTTQLAGGGCTFSLVGTPSAHGQYAHGAFNATVAEAVDAGGASHTLGAGSYNFLY